MIEPKTFYRDFDNLLKSIRLKKKDHNFLYSILNEVQAKFGDTLCLGAVRVYEDRGDQFVLIKSFDHQNGRAIPTAFALDDPAVQRLLKHGSYIYDESEMTIDPAMTDTAYYAIPAAILVRSPEQRWIVVFELKAGWVREEVTFALNAIRTALNYRLFSDAVKTDLEQAAQIQHSLLPGELPRIRGYELAARSQQTEIVGGDLYDFYEFEEDIFGVCVGDASGHGLPAALVVRDVVIGLRMGLEKHMKMVYTLQKLNNVIYRSTYSSRFVSLFYGEIERDGHLIYVNAGHPAPFLVHGDQVVDLKATGLILGAVQEIRLHRSYAHMAPGSVLVLYTDGIFERENRNEETFTINRLKQLVVEHQNEGAQQLLDRIFEAVYEFGNRGKWEDDSTVVVIKRLLTGVRPD